MKKIVNYALLALLLTLGVVASKAAEPKQPDKEGGRTNEVLAKMLSFYSMGIDEKLYLQTDKPYYSSGDTIWCKGYLRNAITHKSLDNSNFIYVELIDKYSKLVSRVKVKRDTTGFNGYLMLDPQMDEGDYTLRAYTRWMLKDEGDFLFNKSLKIISSIPASSNIEKNREKVEKKQSKEASAKIPTTTYYSVQFLPEGGALLEGITQVVAFKAVGDDGLSVEVSGAIYDSKDNLISEISSTYKGMGMVALTAAPEEQYYAVVTSESGVERRFELPVAQSEGAVVTTRKSGGRVLFQVHSTSPELLEGAYIVVHSHGQVFSVSEASDLRAINALSLEGLLDGVNVISLVGADHSVISERLFFKRPSASPTLDLTPSKTNYTSRERATLSINVKDSSGEAAQGEFGISITDNSSVKHQEESENILSYLLLSSDIRGYVEDPGLYFVGDVAQCDRNLDLLMRTQGWRRFDLSEVLQESVERPQSRYEDIVEVSGNVKGFFGNEARKPQLILMCPPLNVLESCTLEDTNKFRFVGLDVPDSTTYVIQSRSRNGGNTLTLNIEPETFLDPKATIAPRAQRSYIPTAFVNQSQEKFFYEGGVQLFDIDAVFVTAHKENIGSTFSGATYASGREKLSTMSSFTLSTIIQTFPGMSVRDDAVYYRQGFIAATFLVDGMTMEYEDISLLSADEIEEIGFFSGADAAMYSNAAGGVFVITLRLASSTGVNSVTAPGIAFVSLLGYQKSATFYTPDYATPAIKRSTTPDFRTTIFWDGTLSPDENGNIEVEFYTADKATDYTITVEGVTDDGEIVRKVEQVERR